MAVCADRVRDRPNTPCARLQFKRNNAMTLSAANPVANPTLNEINQTLGFNKLALCRDGVFVANVNDTYIGRSLLQYGEHNAQEAMTLNQIIAPNDIVLEIGANIGPFTVGIARKVGPQG